MTAAAAAVPLLRCNLLDMEAFGRKRKAPLTAE